MYRENLPPSGPAGKPRRTDEGDEPPAGDGTAGTDARSVVREEILRLAERFEAADRLAKRVRTVEDREEAERQRREAAGAFWAAGSDLADLFLLMLRFAMRHRPEALAERLEEILGPQLDSLADAIARLEDR